MSPDQFIEFAAQLADDGDAGAAACRSAVSRAYYGAYLSALQFVEAKLGIPCRWGRGQDLSPHQVLQRFLMGCQVPEGQEVGQRLSMLHEYRKDADYEMQDVTFEARSEAQLCVERARIIMQRLGECDSVLLRPKIIAGITQYRRLVGLIT